MWKQHANLAGLMRHMNLTRPTDAAAAASMLSHYPEAASCLGAKVNAFSSLAHGTTVTSATDAPDGNGSHHVARGKYVHELSGKYLFLVLLLVVA
jgi:hypothetical protein